MKLYKGFNQDMTCRGYQFEEGKTYTHEGDVELCQSGFHACENPLDCFTYYNPAESVYHEVEMEDVSPEREKDSKVAGGTIKIGDRISVGKMVQIAVDYINTHVDKTKKQQMMKGFRSAASNTGNYSAASNTGDYSAASNTGFRSAASNTGYYSAASNTGNRSAASNTGDYSAASNTGDCSAASNTGDHSAASNTGDCSAASNTGFRSAASNTGYYSAASNTGNRSAASNTGDYSAASNTGDYSAASNTGDHSAAEVSGKQSVTLAIGKGSKVRGETGCWIVCAEWAEDGIKDVQCARVDGETIKAGVWYTLRGGKFVEV